MPRVEGARILVVEDDEVIGGGLERALRSQGYAPEWVRTIAEAVAAVEDIPPAMVLLDLGLPDGDGVDLCRQLRVLVPDAVIVVLTARSEEIDIVVGLDAGADDYVVKPFRLAELLARVRAHLRRSPARSEVPERLVAADVVVDTAGRRAFVAGNEVTLRAKEFDLLSLLVAEAGRVVTRERLMSEVWDQHWFGSTKTLDMHISSLRRRLGEEGSSESRITTLRGVGYRFESGA
jgi:DNA-binding response OmpR family regulator